MSKSVSKFDRQKRLEEVIAAYAQATDAGQAVESREWIDRYPDLSPELAEFIADEAAMQQLVRNPAASNRKDHVKSQHHSDTKAAYKENDSTFLPASESEAASTENRRLENKDLMRSRQFGDYEIVRELGKGGMGIVYEARQTSLNRTVALKVLLPGMFPTHEHLARLQNEAEVAAALDHPAIAPIYEVGQHDGQPYFTMKLVDGGSLATHLKTYGNDPQRAARLVLTITEAVQHAHQRGVLHRDLKPANVLVDQNGKPHITDFGLARRIESDSQLTQTGAILGTPSYMAPEQTTGDKGLTTTATDVYGLGAILYTMLTGDPPFRGDSVITTIEHVRQRAPDPPSRSNPKVRRDLEAICLKCLEKNRDDRYMSAASLSGDLRRFLNGKPVEARPVGKAVRMRRWCHRNPAIAALSATAVLLLVAGLAATSVGWFSTASALDQARVARFDAELRLQDSQMAVNELLIAVNNSPEMQHSGFERVRRRLLSRAETFLRKLTENAPDDPRLKRQHNEIRFSLARLKSSLSDFDGARSIADKLLAELPDTDTSNEQQIKRRIDLSRFLAQQYFRLNNIPKRAHYVGRSLELARENFGGENASIEDQIELATTLSELASIILKWGDNTLSADLANEAVLIWDNLDIDIDDPETRLTMGKVYLIAGKARSGAQQKAQSKLAIKMAIQIFELLYDDHETVRPETLFLLAESHKGMGWLHDKDFESAKKSYERAQLIAQELVLEHPLVPDYHVKRLNVDTSFGISCGINGKTEESLALLEANANEIPDLMTRFPESRQALEKTLGTNYSMIGYVCNMTDDYTRAYDTQQKARLLYEKQFARNGGSPQTVLDLAMCDGNIASALVGLKRLDEAQNVIEEKAMPALLELLENDPKNGTARRYMWANYGDLAIILQKKGQPKFALMKFQQAMEYFFSDVEQVYCREAAYLARAGEFETAVARFTVFFEFEPEVGVYASTSQPTDLERAMRASQLIKAMTETQSSHFDAQAKQQLIDQVAELGILALSSTANDPKFDDEAMVQLLDNSKMEALKATAQFAKWMEKR